MLLEFKMKNFKSFRNLVEFKMTPAQKIKDLEYSLLKEKAKKRKHYHHLLYMDQTHQEKQT